ncbi:MAG: hypothetical protein EOM80_19040 [Erysipelotrichia bacterium]|nr:hypothetical protein [Erysipelotrichia bacterium]
MKNCTLFSRLTKDYDTGAALVVLENLPFYKNATMTPIQLRRLAAKLITIADEAGKDDAGEFKDGATMEQYYQISSYHDTEIFCDGDAEDETE